MNDHAPQIDREPGGPLVGGALESGVQVGDFRIERRIGAGGMGIVYQARQISLNRTVALKVLGQALTRSADVSRFQREAQAAARLKHPAIAQVYYIGQDRHLCYLAMELIDGISLRRALDRLSTTQANDSSLDSIVKSDLVEQPSAASLRFDQPTEAATGDNGQAVAADPKPAADVNPYLSPQARELRTSKIYVRRVCELIRDAARALAHAHEQGVIHRDIKPDNLLLDRGGQVHVIDFGVARFFEDQAVTYTGQLVGTPLYMSPEQVTGRGAIDARTDVYSLGLVLYELLTLKPPIEATNRENLLRTIVTKPLAPISWRNKAVPPELERIIHRATQKDPDQRYATAAQLADDLDRFLDSKPVVAPPYHFRLDEREITAARPGGVVLAAFIFFLVSFFVAIFFAATALMMGLMAMGSEGLVIGGTFAAFAAVVLGAGVTVGYGLLAAHQWARWTGVVLASLVTLLAATGVIGIIVGVVAVATNEDSIEKFFQGIEEQPKDSAGSETQTVQPQNFVYALMGFYGLPIAVGLFLGGTALWALLNRATGAWFRFAAEIRAEHRLVRMRLAE
ncbi:MAG TPA: serine/threonine-protein kinase [Pirellulaceae bacterium]|nr:serine/threonine-protein kinase [Pirellulaceae bacterium]